MNTAAGSVVLVLLLVVSGCVARVTPESVTDPIPTTTEHELPEFTCVYNGTIIKEGESFHRGQCGTPCSCGEGRIFCVEIAKVPCRPPPCVDPVDEDDPCSTCKVCPYGINCQTPDGAIINGTDSVQIDERTECSCDGYMPFATCYTYTGMSTMSTVLTDS